VKLAQRAVGNSLIHHGVMVDGVFVWCPSEIVVLSQVYQLLKTIEGYEQRYPQGFNRFYDLRNVQRAQVNAEEVAKIGWRRERELRCPNQQRVAFVSSNPVIIGLLRVYELFMARSQLDIRIFSDLDRAMEYVGLTAGLPTLGRPKHRTKKRQ
jgi:hypothetical protein